MQSQTPTFSIRPYPFQSSHSRWLAVTHRDPSSHSSFFYGVKSTKIYCRPTCSARLARRANVVFYDSEDQARRDGFRPCKRCKPDDTTFVGEGEEVVSRVIGLLRVRKDGLPLKGGLSHLAKEAGITRSYLCRVFKKKMGMTIGAYMKEFEMEASEGETESSIQSPCTDGSGVVGVETGLLTPATTARSPSTSVEGREDRPVEKDAGDIGEALDLDFDFDEWLWTDLLE
ncbi:uncharacterized protein BDR25DRAFT_337604 [Lindgomyces ingoldianus]|uniref:Uncharacterized protein n=1 Tax=Lindgomyces ingoldianus TaxID=673940 RepID=A0ACB6QDA8_9PLEO|nr:uncharacterized protein BDR25DRAFT_337604 [Lindgomyces ingoldianus]KAF2464107.1 hypothetical protein BDR25DRAFT_337604 [Lindgomyces ingoldianus]